MNSSLYSFVFFLDCGYRASFWLVLVKWIRDQRLVIARLVDKTLLSRETQCQSYIKQARVEVLAAWRRVGSVLS